MITKKQAKPSMRKVGVRFSSLESAQDFTKLWSKATNHLSGYQISPLSPDGTLLVTVYNVDAKLPSSERTRAQWLQSYTKLMEV